MSHAATTIPTLRIGSQSASTNSTGLPTVIAENASLASRLRVETR
jgi:hypothetical protein